MLTAIVSLVILLSGSFFCSVWLKKSFEDTIPISTLSVVAVLYLFGLLGILKAGYIAVVSIAVILYIAAAIGLIRKRNTDGIKRCFFTSGLLGFAVLFFAMFVLDIGKVAHTYDEFSQWMDAAKIMTFIDDFGTNPASNSGFPSYPPGLALFEYLFQRINLTLYPSADFDEGLVYFGYQVLFLSLFFPFLKGQSFKKPMSLLLSYSAVLFPAMLFYPDFYSYIYSDPMISVLSAAGMIRIMTDKERDWSYHCYLSLVCFLLAIVKDSGMLFSVVLSVVYFADIIVTNQFKLKEAFKKTSLKYVKYVTVLLIPPVTKALWSLEVATSKVRQSFGNPVEVSTVISVFTGQDNSYRKQVLLNYINKFFTERFIVGASGIVVPYYLVIFLLVFGTFFLWKALDCRRLLDKSKKFILIASFVQLIAYILGLCIAYMFKFSELEALASASFSRYINVALFSTAYVLILMAAELVRNEAKRTEVKEGILLLALVIIVPVEGIRSLINGRAFSQELRMAYNSITEQINNECQDVSRVWVISQNNGGSDVRVIRFATRRKTENGSAVVPRVSWSIGEPFHEHDTITKNIDADQWREQLINGFDYVALYRRNDYFDEHYAELFADPSQIADDSLYRLNRETGLLELCE